MLKYVRLFTGKPYIDKIKHYIKEYQDKLLKDLAIAIDNKLIAEIEKKNIDAISQELYRVTNIVNATLSKIKELKIPTPRGGRSWRDTIAENIQTIELYNDKITITFKYPVDNVFNFSITEEL